MSTPLTPDWLAWPETKQLVAAFAPGTLRFVGGAVRDALLARAVTDVDAATTLPPQQAMARLEKAGIKAIPTGIDHGTVTAVIGARHFEITTLRRDVATDGRHAEIAYTDNWEEDAKRRDFTMNALYLSPEGALYDYFGGEKDARAGRVRFIGEPEQRISEDYLRILRFFRFHAWYGNGSEPDEKAIAACVRLASQMKQLSGERIQQEMLKLLAAPDAYDTVDRMHAERLLPSVLGFDIRDCAMLERFDAIARATKEMVPPFLKLSAFFLKAELPPDQALDKIVERLRLSQAMARDLQSALLHYDEIEENLSEAAQKKKLRRLGNERFRQAVLVQWAHGDDVIAASHPYQAMLRLAHSWQPPLFPVTGDDLIALGIKPGKALGDTLRQLEEAWEESHYALTREALLKSVK